MPEENVLHGPAAEVQPVTYSAGIFMYQKLMEYINNEYLFVSIGTHELICYSDLNRIRFSMFTD